MAVKTGYNNSDVATAVYTIVNSVTYTLVTSIVPGKHYIIVNEDKDKAMGGQNSNNRAAIDVTDDNGSITFNDNNGVREFVIYGPDANGRYSIYDGKEGGYLYAASSGSNYLKTQTTNNINGEWKITFNGDVASIVADGSSYSRNVMQYNSSSSLFACYASASQDDVYLYEKAGEAAPTVPVTISSYEWATFVNPCAVNFEGSGIKAYAVTGRNGSSLTLSSALTTVPGNTPLLLNASEGSCNIPVATSASAVGTNLLKKGTGVAISAVDGKTRYVLGVEGGKATFLKIDDVSATVPTNKAYLEFEGSVPAPVLTFDGDESTGIDMVKDEGFKVNGEFYNLNGQRVAQPTKGLYIVNGKKVVIK